MAPGDASRGRRTPLTRYVEWLNRYHHHWTDPDLVAFAEHLAAHHFTPETIYSYVCTVRGQYKTLLHDNRIRDALYAIMPRDADFASRKAMVDEVLTRIENALLSANDRAKPLVRQDRPDGDVLRLTPEQANTLLGLPGVDTLRGLRDTALIALALCTGTRRAELADLEVRDLHQRLGGELALHIREGKGRKEQLVPYGDLAWCLDLVDAWLEAACIIEGSVFRGITEHDVVMDTAMVPQSINRLLARYRIEVNGAQVHVKPHDLRRTYARRQYEAGLDLVALQQNLGHQDTKTTLGYIGNLDGDARKGKDVFRFDFSKLGGD
jgi:site-specific recombinase XerD